MLADGRRQKAGQAVGQCNRGEGDMSRQGTGQEGRADPGRAGKRRRRRRAGSGSVIEERRTGPGRAEGRRAG